jgi:hypothetical protein
MQQLLQQQEAQMQQHKLTCLRQQLLQVKELHKRKMQQLKQQLKQQYEVQLQATTAAYAQELAQIQSHLAYSRKSGGLRASSAAAASAAAIAAAGAAGQDLSSASCSPRPRHMQQHEQPVSSSSSPVRAPTHQHMQQQHYQQQQQRHSSGCQDLNVPAEVLEYAERYQHGGLGRQVAMTVGGQTAAHAAWSLHQCCSAFEISAYPPV